MSKGITVVSMFDGMACGLVALKRLGIKVDKYYAFEIDKYAIKIALKNHPEIIQLGDVNDWEKHKDEITPDLLIAGSPCQGFSIAGQMLNFEDPRSKLFFVFVDALKYWHRKNPELKFMLENVRMKEEWKNVITQFMGVDPVLINSALVSAQNRNRLYWMNWGVEQPEDRGLVLRDIIEDGDVDRLKSYCVDANYWKGGNEKSYFGKGRRQLVFIGGIGEKDWAQDGKGLSRNFPQGSRVYSDEGKASALSAQGVGGKGGMTGIYRIGTATDINGHDYNKRIYSQAGKSPTLNAHQGGNIEPKIAQDDVHYRKLTPLECERLQTLDDNYTEGVSNTQRYKMIGNGWTVDVIKHIFSFANFT